MNQTYISASLNSLESHSGQSKCQKHWCCHVSPAWPSLLCMKPVCYCKLQYTVTKYCYVGYDNWQSVWRFQILLLLLLWFEFPHWWKVSRNSHVSGAEPMRAETLIPKQQASLHHSKSKGIQTGFRKQRHQINFYNLL